MKRRTAYDRIRLRVARMKTNVFLREDFADLASYTQVSRVIKRLTDEGVLYRLGYGVYSKTEIGIYTGRILPKGGVTTVKEAVRRLGITVSPSRALREYNAGSTQVPNGRTIGVDRRITRKLGYESFQLRYELVNRKTRLEKLVASITPENRHGETMNDTPVGKEIIPDE